MKKKQYLSLNSKVIRHNGNIFKIIAVNLFGTVLVDAECTVGDMKGKVVNLITDRSALAKELRQDCKMGLVS